MICPACNELIHFEWTRLSNGRVYHRECADIVDKTLSQLGAKKL